MTGSIGAADWAGLAARLTGPLLRPGAPGYEAVRAPAVARFAGVRPRAIARARTTADVAAALHFARARELPVAVRSGGHDFAGRSTTTGLLIDLAELDRITYSGDDQVVTVGAGVRLGALYPRLARHGCTVPAGCGATVGVAGLTLGGGLGVLGRTHGLTCDHLRAVEVVLPDGRTVTADAAEHADLFWALRGAGAVGLGVVTALRLATVAAPATSVFALGWPAESAAAVLTAWLERAPDAPSALAASLLVSAGADPQEPVRVTVLGAAPGLAPDRTARWLAELAAAAGSAPARRRLVGRSYPAAKQLLAQWAPGEASGHPYSRSEFFDQSLPAAAVAELVGRLTADRVPGEARELDFSPWSGAYAAVSPAATAFTHRRARFLLKHTASLDPDRIAAPGRWLERSAATVRPWGTGGVYPNFPDPDLTDPGRAYFGANWPRVRRIKRRYDPDGVLGPLGR